MSSKPKTPMPKSSNDLPGPRPRKDKERDMQQAIAEDADKTEDADRDLVHGDGGSVGLRAGVDELNHDD
jgi:hypothetical protein